MVAKAQKVLETSTLTGVEVLAIGTWNSDLYTAKDLSDMAEAFLALKGKIDPVLKLGHDRGQSLAQKDGYPALGWASRVYVQGNKLLADFERVPRKVAELIQSGAYDKVSSEVYFDREIDGVIYPRVLKAVALLGADAPAVKDIRSISDVADLLYRDTFPADEAHYAEIARDYDWGDDLPATNVGAALTSSMEDSLERLVNSLTRFAIITDDEEDAIKAAWEIAEDAFNGAVDPAILARPVAGKIAQGMYEEPAKKPAPGDDENETPADGGDGDDEGDMADDELSQLLAAHDAHARQIEMLIAGKPGAKRIRTFLGTARRELASMKSRTPFATNTEEVDMTTKELAELLGLPETATDAEIKAKMTSLQEASNKVTELSDTVAVIQRERVEERVYAEVDKAINVEGKFPPAQRDSLRAYAMADIEGFRNLAKSSPRLAFLTGPIGSESVEGGDDAPPTAVQASVASQLGTTKEMRERSTKSTREYMEEHARKVAV